MTEEYLNMVQWEWDDIYPSYLPSIPVSKDALILDGGAGCGESGKFFEMHGYTNIRMVELNHDAAELCRLNHPGADVREKPFSLSDLEGVAYAKLDVEGGEALLLQLERLPCEMVIAIHSHELEERLRAKFPNNSFLRNIGHRGKLIEAMWRFFP